MDEVFFPVPRDEELRIRELHDLGLLQNTGDHALDRLVQMACRVFDTPMAAISLIGRDRQVLKARVGLAYSETSRDISICAHNLDSDELLVIPNALLDARFSSNPLVTGAPHIRFYAGAPWISPSGVRLGGFCVIDDKPRPELPESSEAILREFAAMAVERMVTARPVPKHVTSNVPGAAITPERPLLYLAAANDCLIFADRESRITFWNKAAERLFGHSAADAIGQPLSIIVPERLRSAHYAGMTAAASDDGRPNVNGKARQVVALRADGSEFHVELTLSSWNEPSGPHFGAVIRDVTERRERERRLTRLSELDPLTRLINRAGLRVALEERLRRNTPMSLLLLDIDGFKEVNDTLGHTAGDALLKTIAFRIRANVGTGPLVARLGGDEFVVLLDNADPLRAVELGNALICLIEEPLNHDGHPIHVSASIGIALSDGDKGRVDELLSEADLALYRAKAEGRHHCQVFTPDLRRQALKKRDTAIALRDALKNGELELFYQPQVDLRDRSLTGAEALLRWRHPEFGLLSPAAFLPAITSGPLALEIGSWVLETACRQAACWRAQRFPDLRIGVNLFGAQIAAPDFAERVKSTLTHHDLPPSALELEITEDIVLKGQERAVASLRVLRSMGVGIAFDDYGTGFASLSLLKTYPLTRLKIDRSFTAGAADSASDRAVVKAVLCLAQGFGLSVTAEGIERGPLATMLKRMRCEEGQGYLFGRPMPAEDFERLSILAPSVGRTLSAA